MSWRFVISTALGQLIDSGTFVAVAFTGRLPLREMFQVSFTGWAIMVTWEIAALPLTVSLVKTLKRTENVDYFDTYTDFNPLHFRHASQYAGRCGNIDRTLSAANSLKTRTGRDV